VEVKTEEQHGEMTEAEVKTEVKSEEMTDA
jgi:hypothetical protein